MKMRGFTLVEILVVLAIVGILSAITIFYTLRHIQRSRQSHAMEEMKDISTALAIPLELSGHYPNVLPISEIGKKDPWNHAYVYTSTGESYELRCLGKDGVRSDPITPDHRDDFNLDIVMVDGQFVNSPF